MSNPVYLGFDLSTQQLKCLAISSQLKVVNQAKFDFDADSHGFDVDKGVLVNPDEGEVYAPVALWLQALDAVLQRIRDDGLDLTRVRGICGSGMQHGCAFWNHDASTILSSLDPARSLEDQLGAALAHPDSPNWQDASTTAQCDAFNQRLGSPDELARQTGSKAHHRFTGPQIMRFRQKYPDHYEQTARISLVSSWIATVFLGHFAPFDISDACGMNLRNITTGTWNDELLELVAGGEQGVAGLKQKLGDVPEDGGATFGRISAYFVKRHGFDPSCRIIASTGDNPATILSLPLRENDAIVSLGTSSTFLMVTPEYRPDPAYHFFNSPTTAGLYMFMLCYKNGGLAREKVRNTINSLKEKDGSKADQNTWHHFDQALSETTPLARKEGGRSNLMNLGVYFPRPEIVPELPKGEWHFEYDPATKELRSVSSTPETPHDDARIIVESQFLSMRLRSRKIVKVPSSPGVEDGEHDNEDNGSTTSLPAQPRRIYLVGGGSRNRAIAKLCGQILGGSEGVYKLDVGENACALGAAHKAVWGVERKEITTDDDRKDKLPQTESFEDFIEARWNEDEFVEKIADGYQKEYFDLYGQALEGFEQMEQRLLEGVTKDQT